MTFTVVYLDSRRMPKETRAMEVDGTSPEDVLSHFMNLEGMENQFVAAVFEGPKSRVHLTKDDVPKLLSAEARVALEWSWDLGIAELMAEDTSKNNGRWINSGIRCARDASEEELIVDFLTSRFWWNGPDTFTLDKRYAVMKTPLGDDTEKVFADLIAEIKVFPDFDKLRQEAWDDMGD